MSVQASGSSRAFTQALFVISIVAAIWECTHLSTWLHATNSDIKTFYLPWYEALLKAGRFHGMAGAYANYTPPTLYLFSVASMLQQVVTPIVLLKLVNVPFVIASALFGHAIAIQLGANRSRAAAVSLLVLVMPEVWQNAFRWGQYDSVYTTFLLGTVWATLGRRSWLAAALYGSALAFKLQAIFLAPALIAMLLTGELAWAAMPIVPAVSVIWMVPAALAGRPWMEIFGVYRQQKGLFPALSVDAPNIYFLFQDSIAPGIALREACHIADFLALAVTGWAVWNYIVAHRRDRKRWKRDFVLLVAVTQLSIPYFLPHMHERYFFAGNLFATLLLATETGMMIVLALMQMACIVTYHFYFMKDAVGITVAEFILPVTAATIAVVAINLHFRSQVRCALQPAHHR